MFVQDRVRGMASYCTFDLNCTPGLWKSGICLAPSETIVELVKKNKKYHLGYSLRVRTLGVMHGCSLVHFT
jgi:hypothetical protein